MTEDEKALLWDWEMDLRVICHGHYQAATTLDKMSYWIGIPTIILAGTAGSAAFSSVTGASGMFAGAASLAAAGLASAQLFFRYPERAERHRATASLFGALLREIEQAQVIPPADSAALDVWCKDFRERWDEIARDTAAVPHRIWNQMCDTYKKPKPLKDKELSSDSC